MNSTKNTAVLHKIIASKIACKRSKNQGVGKTTPVKCIDVILFVKEATKMGRYVMEGFMLPSPKEGDTLDEVVFGQNVYKFRYEDNVAVLSRVVKSGRRNLTVNMRFVGTPEQHEQAMETLKRYLVFGFEQ